MIFLHRQNTADNITDCEIDVRSSPSGLILNHDRLDFSKDYLLLRDFAKMYSNKTVICNVKESGIEEEIYDIMMENNVDFYLLDSQIPDIIRLSKIPKFKGRFIIRVSDVEMYSSELINLAKPKYIWADWTKFNDFNVNDYLNFINTLNTNIELIVVSPELYSKDYENIIELIASSLEITSMSVCTKRIDIWRKYIVKS
jgi:hypothetical protein